MTKRDKRLSKIRQNPVNVPFDDLRKLPEDYGFVIRRSKGSHYSFVGTVKGEKVTLVIPYKRSLNSVYVNKALALIDEIEADTHPADNDEESSDDE